MDVCFVKGNDVSDHKFDFINDAGEGLYMSLRAIFFSMMVKLRFYQRFMICRKNFDIKSLTCQYCEIPIPCFCQSRCTDNRFMQ